MTDIFLSYSRVDQVTARLFAEAFEREGLSVWWDQTLRAGEVYDRVTEKALQEAKAVVVLWSKKSVESHWVRSEATQAHSNGTLVPVMIEPCKRPIMFELMHTAELAHWKGDSTDPAWRTFLGDVRMIVEKGADPIRLSADDSRTAIARSTTFSASSPVERAPSIAVLPFANMSGDKDQEYFSDGLAEEIINALAQITGLKVIARTSAFAFKGQNTDIRRIADTLGVAHILEGSVRRSGSRIRVTAQLITATDGSHLWSERYDRELADVFAVQDEMSSAICGALKVRLTSQTCDKPRYTPNLPAYEALLKARHFHWKVTTESMEQAKSFYEQAIALDPQFALAHTLYADYLYGRTTLGMSPMREVAPVVRALALRALDLDPSLADAHGSLGLMAATCDYDWKEAGRQFALATPGGKGSPLVHLGCACAYALASGQRDEAVRQVRLAVQGDPLHLTYRTCLGMCLGAAGHFDEAQELLLQTQDLDPTFFWAHYYSADLFTARRKFSDALPFAEKAYSLSPWYAPSVGIYAGLLVRMGQPDHGKEVLKTLGSGETYGAAKGMAIFHVCCDEIDLAADRFERAIEERDSPVGQFLQGAIGEPVRASRHWPRLAALMNLPEVTSDESGLVPTGVTNA